MNTHAATLAVHVGRALLLPPSGPRDPRLVLGVRTADLRRVHDVRPGRDPLPGSRERRRRQAVPAAHDPERAASDECRRGTGDDGADRAQRRRLRDHRRAGRRHQPPGGPALLDWALQRRGRLGRRVVAARDGDVPARQHAPPGLQHVRPLLARHDHRAGARNAALPARLRRLGSRRIGGRTLVQLGLRRHGRRLRARSSASSAPS